MYIQLYQKLCQLSVVEPHTEEQATQSLGWSWSLGQMPRESPGLLCPRDKLFLIKSAIWGALFQPMISP